MRSGNLEKLPYSLSRWTDLPAAKWAWFQEQLEQGWMIGIDPRTAIPDQWSLAVDETFGLVFWTRDASNLVAHHEVLKPYPLVIHYTLTGWHEVEKGSPSVDAAIDTMSRAVDLFGPDRLTWRFSPVPLVPDVVDRFAQIAPRVQALGITEVYLAFLQENDLLPETRPLRTRRELLKQMASFTKLDLQVCAEDRTLEPGLPRMPLNLGQGICESGVRFAKRRSLPETEGCGCALAVDPFTVNESCTFGCGYCYAADKSLAPKKLNTTRRRHLRILP